VSSQNRAALELGFSPDQAAALQQIAFDELSVTKDRPRLQSFKPITLVH